jgi:hypothetical protein
MLHISAKQATLHSHTSGEVTTFWLVHITSQGHSILIVFPMITQLSVKLFEIGYV